MLHNKKMHCSSCGHIFAIEELAGEDRIKCPKCGHVLKRNELKRGKIIHVRPISSTIGLLLLFMSVGGGMPWAQSMKSASEFGGFGVFLIIMVWLFTIPVSLILGVVGLCRRETPGFLPKLLIVLCIIPLVYYLYLLGINRS